MSKLSADTVRESVAGKNIYIKIYKWNKTIKLTFF